MKVTDLKYGEAIHCQTEKDANEICKLMYKAGLKWIDNRSYLELNNNWNRYKERTCYFPNTGTYGNLNNILSEVYSAKLFIRESKINKLLNEKTGTYSDLEYYQKECFKIYPAKLFIRESKINQLLEK